jgi:streptogramin lyase
MFMRNSKLTIFLLFILPVGLFAIRTHRISHQGYGDFIKGKIENIQIDNNGVLTNAPKLDSIADIEEPIVWKGVCTPEGEIYLGTGNKGQVYRVRQDGSSEVIFSPDEILTRAVAVDSQGSVFIGTSPKGKVYRIPPGGGRAEIYFNPPETYIWDMLIDPAGNLYVAVGNSGKIYKLPPNYQKDSDAILWFDSGHMHLYKLALDFEGNLITGSGPNGYLFRIKEKGKAEILYSTDDKEISQIVTMADGRIVFSTFSKQTQPANNNQEKENDNNATANVPKPNPRQVFSKIYVMNPDLHTKELWVPTNTSIFSIYPINENEWLVGTGSEGNLYRVESDGSWSLLQVMPKGGQITDIHPMQGEGEKFLIITSNPSNLYQLSLDDKANSHFTSEVVDAKQKAFWGKIQPFTLNPENKKLIKIESRTGNSPKPDATWSDWLKIDERFTVQSPAGRFLQYKVDFEQSDIVLRNIDLFYHHENQKPEITNINIIPMGFAVVQNDLTKINLSFDKLTGSDDPTRFIMAKPPMPKLVLESPNNAITVGWNAKDPNDDRLEFKVQIRNLGSEEWVTLQDHLDLPVFSSTTQGFEDGYYELQVIASDLPSNPVEMAMKDVRVTQPFPIDTRSPEIVILSKELVDNYISVRFSAKDEISNIQNVAYKVGGDQVYQAFPEDRLFDSSFEEFEIKLDITNPQADRSLLIEALDTSGNRSIQKITF